jgi:ribosome-binding protein aMBF1 (putative translation factor)
MEGGQVSVLEVALDSLEDLVEVGRETLRRQASAAAQEKVFREIVEETGPILAKLKGESEASKAAAPAVRRHRQPGVALSAADRIKLNKARNSKSLSQAALGKKVGASGGYICNLEKGRGTVSSEVLKNLRSVLGVELGS